MIGKYPTYVEMANAIRTAVAAATATMPVGIPVGGSTGQVLSKVSATDYDVTWQTATATDSRIMLYKATAVANQTNNSNTNLQAITGLSLGVTSGRRYHFKAMGQYQTAATTTGLTLGLINPPNTTYAGWNVQIQQAAAGTDQMYTNAATSLTTRLTSASVVAANTTYGWEMEGFFQPSTDGFLTLGFASEVNLSVATLVPGAILIVTDFG